MAAPVDIPSDRLALQLQRQDVIALCQALLPPRQYVALGEQLAAIREQELELDLLEMRYASQRMQQSMYLAMLADGRQIAEDRRIEQQAIDDRREAARVADQPDVVVPEQVQEQIGDQVYDDDRIALLEETGPEVGSEHTRGGTAVTESEERGIAVSGTDETNPDQPFDLDAASGNILGRYMAALRLDESGAEEEQVLCSICTDEFAVSEVLNPPSPNCDHIWCRGCIVTSFEAAAHSESSWPPRCCSERIAVEAVQHFLDPELRVRFEVKSLEWSTTDRTYCHELRCSTFIPRDTIEGRRATCTVCQLNTCSICKAEYHDDTDVCSALQDHRLREEALRNEWQQCPGCQRLIELTHGCNHIT